MLIFDCANCICIFDELGQTSIALSKSFSSVALVDKKERKGKGREREVEMRVTKKGEKKKERK